MATLLTRMRFAAGALALAFIVACAAPVGAQQRNPTARSIRPRARSTEEQLLRELDRITGRCTLPDQKACTIEQPAGRDWRHFHQVTLPWIGAIAILGMLALLVVFYLIRGMVRIESGRSGRTIVRFNAFERFVHWMTATCFIILALVGPQHHVRQAAAAALDEPGDLHGVLAVGQIRPQLSELPVHARRGADLPDVDRRQYPEQGRCRVAQGGRRHRRPRASAGRPVQRRPEDDLLDRRARRRGGGDRAAIC